MVHPVVDEVIRVLIVEDERIIAQELKLTLEGMGLSVTGIGGSEQQALQLVERDRPDVVLMDINLGRGGDGTVAAREIASRFRIPVIYVSAYASPDVLQRAAPAAPYGYVLKPFDTRELNAAIRMAMARRREELKAESAERRFRLALDAARLGVIEVDRESQQVFVDGHQPVGDSGTPRSFSMPLQLFLGRLDDEEVRARTYEALLFGTVTDIRAAWRAAGEERVWVDIHACYFEVDGKVVGILRDVTQQVLADERLRQASVVFESAGDAILILDREQKVCMANAAFTRQTGWQAEEVHGMTPDEFLHAARRSDHRQHGGTGEDDVPRAEVTCRRRDGTLFPAWQSIAPVMDGGGAVTNYVLSFCDISRLRETEDRLLHVALHDALTGLGNRHHLDIQLRHRIARAASPGGVDRFAVLFIDLDGFKHFNDTLGHKVGDAILIEVANRLRRNVRQDDLIVRLGGDEFLVIMEGARVDADIYHMAHKLLRAIAEPMTVGAEPSAVQMTGSIGVAVFPDHADSADELIKAADTAMYEAKHRGRDRHAFFTPALAGRAVERLHLEQGLRVAIANKELHLLWQPFVDLKSGAVLGAEALLRWTHPASGSISPERFIPVAEETGLIISIGDWVLEQACRQAAAWRAGGLAFDRIAVNVSALQLQQPDFAEKVGQCLQRSGLPPSALELELTESSLQRGEHVQATLRGLRERGVRLALDDFGTGFSSLSMLKFLPLDRLKIDRSFIRDVATDPNDMAITRTISAMASALGFTLTAEGVETEIQRNILLGLNVQEAQGWYYHPALAPERLAQLLPRA